MQGVIKEGVGDTPKTLVGDAHIHHEVDRPRSVRQVSRQLDVCTPLTRLRATWVVLTLVVLRKYTC